VLPVTDKSVSEVQAASSALIPAEPTGVAMHRQSDDDVSRDLAAAFRILSDGLCTGDMETILLTVLMAADENRIPCCRQAEDRILAFLSRLSECDAILPDR
jgi:hypothetical protein